MTHEQLQGAKMVFELLDGEALINTIKYFRFRKDDNNQRFNILFEIGKKVYLKRFGSPFPY